MQCKLIKGKSSKQKKSTRNPNNFQHQKLKHFLRNWWLLKHLMHFKRTIRLFAATEQLFYFCRFSSQLRLHFTVFSSLYPCPCPCVSFCVTITFMIDIKDEWEREIEIEIMRMSERGKKGETKAITNYICLMILAGECCLVSSKMPCAAYLLSTII